MTPDASTANPERGPALYLLAVCQRQLGLKELGKPANNADEEKKVRQAADQKFEAARQSFRTAVDWFAGQKQEDWSARCR